MAEILRWQDEMKTVAERWKRQYHSRQHGWGTIALGSTKEIYDRLKALPDIATVANVNAAIGTNGWVEFWCNECKDYVPVAVQIGAEPDCESSTAVLCFRCFDKAAALVEGERAKVLAEARSEE